MTDCVFCRIARGEIPAKVVARTAEAVAFHDLNPQAPIHVLVVPTRHYPGANDVGSPETGIWSAVMALAVEVARTVGAAERGYRLVVNQGADGGQSVSHLHVHLLAGRRMTWPPG